MNLCTWGQRRRRLNTLVDTTEVELLCVVNGVSALNLRLNTSPLYICITNTTQVEWLVVEGIPQLKMFQRLTKNAM